MGYVGNQTTNAYTSITKQDITGNGGTAYTLDHAVANANEIEVFVNNVRQEPAVAYTVSGTALTMTGNVAASDDFYVVFQGKAVGTVVPPDDSVTTARIVDGAVTNVKVDTVAATKLTGTIDDARMPVGSVVQTLFNSYTTETSVTSTTKGSGTETGLEITVTPKSSSNKLLIQANVAIADIAYTTDSWVSFEIHDGSSIVYTEEQAAYYHNAPGDESFRTRATILTLIDAPLGTTYKVRGSRNSGSFKAQRDGNPSHIVIQEIQQ